MKLYKKILLLSLLLLLLSADKAIARNMNKSTKARVIYEQNTPYADVCQMKKIVEEMNEQKETEKKSNAQVNPIINAMSNDSEQNSSMADMLKTLLKMLGMNSISENSDEQQGLVEDAKSDQRGKRNFKTWESRHNWKGIKSEQR